MAKNDEGPGVELIADERKRQVEKEGWTPEHDDTHTSGELAVAAACYALPEDSRVFETGTRAVRSVVSVLEILWPWWESPHRGAPYMDWWKPTPEDRVRELVKAGALIAAEIDRLQRLREESKRLKEENKIRW